MRPKVQGALQIIHVSGSWLGGKDPSGDVHTYRREIQVYPAMSLLNVAAFGGQVEKRESAGYTCTVPPQGPVGTCTSPLGSSRPSQNPPSQAPDQYDQNWGLWPGFRASGARICAARADLMRNAMVKSKTHRFKTDLRVLRSVKIPVADLGPPPFLTRL